MYSISRIEMINMKRNGFTLIEVLTVIIILGVIGLIVMPVVTNSLKESKDDLYEVQISNIREASKTWAADNIYTLPTETNGSVIVTLETLQSEGYIDEGTKNPKTDELFNTTETCVKVSYNGKKYTYTVLLTADECK